ncbi:hypothetical protein EIN_416950, partial [Entamoeba invadens IP1]
EIVTTRVLLDECLNIKGESNGIIDIVLSTVINKGLVIVSNYDRLHVEVVNVISDIILTKSWEIQKTGIVLLQKALPLVKTRNEVVSFFVTDVLDYLYDMIATNMVSGDTLFYRTKKSTNEMEGVCCQCASVRNTNEMVMCLCCKQWLCSQNCVEIHCHFKHKLVSEKLTRHVYTPRQTDLSHSFDLLLSILNVLCEIKEDFQTNILDFLYAQLTRYLPMKWLPNAPIATIDSVIDKLAELCCFILVQKNGDGTLYQKIFNLMETQVTCHLLEEMYSSQEATEIINDYNLKDKLQELEHVDDAKLLSVLYKIVH